MPWMTARMIDLFRCHDNTMARADPIPMPDPEFWAGFPARVRSAAPREEARVKGSKAGIPVWPRWLFGSIPLAAFAALVLLVFGFILTRGIGPPLPKAKWTSVDLERIVTELSASDPALLQKVISAEAVVAGGWMNDLAQMTDQEMKEFLMAGPSWEGRVLSDPELLQEIYGEEQT